MMTDVDRAKALAIQAHAGQTRKFSGEPYINHPLRVYERVKLYGGDEYQQIAAILHDIVEDTTVTLEEIQEDFGEEVAELVDELTNPGIFTSDKNIRRMLMIEHWENMSECAALIKMCDRIDNLNDIPPEKIKSYWATGYALDGFIMCRLFLGVNHQAEKDLENAVERIMHEQEY